jgi:TldD protein
MLGGVTWRWMTSLLVCLGIVGPSAAQHTDLLTILEDELKRNFAVLTEKADPKPYYLSYTVTDRQITILDASLGSLRLHQTQRQRMLDVSIRVGSPELDNYHRVQGSRGRFTSGSPIVWEDNRDAIVRVLWRDTDRAYRTAAERLNFIRSNSEVRIAERDQSPDFSMAPALQDVQPLATMPVVSGWDAKLKKWSSAFRGHEAILTSSVTATVTVDNRYFVDSAGTRLRHGRTYVRVDASGQAKAADGMNLALSRGTQGEKPEDIPSDSAMEALIADLIRDLEQLQLAPAAEPYVGPAILSGRATAVFFHEIFGHRMEGHRQKDDREGQTFTDQVGKPVLPPFLSVDADPTKQRVGTQDLSGWYAYDDEGVKAERVQLVENGILRGFMLSRSPIKGFTRSNGHGRKAPGNEVVSRQSNLLVNASQTISEAELREALLAEVRRQGKPYGLLFKDVTGGLTTTGREGLQAFTVLPLLVYRVYADGRPDQMIRGVDIVGTPLTSFAKIVAAGDKVEVFNGFCGAESGSIPVSAVSPPLLVSEIETQRRAKANDRPPLLSFPPIPGGAQ